MHDIHKVHDRLEICNQEIRMNLPANSVQVVAISTTTLCTTGINLISASRLVPSNTKMAGCQVINSLSLQRSRLNAHSEILVFSSSSKFLADRYRAETGGHHV